MGWTSKFYGDTGSDFSGLGKSLEGAFSFGADSGRIGTYYWVDEFRQFLFSYSDVMANKRNWKLNPGYSFKVVGGNTNEVFAPFGEFRLPINPSNFNQNEEFAISFKPTQNGMVVEHSGAIFKEIVLSGTTGLQPSSGRPRYDELLSTTGNPINRMGQLGSSAGLIDLVTSNITSFGSKQTGFTWAHLLRNYIRAYAQTKTLPGTSGLSLVFCNKKDGEEWQVEPISIDISRNASGSFLYYYRIVLRATKRNVPEISDGLFDDIIDYVNRVDVIVDNAVTLIESANNVLADSIGLLYQIESAVTDRVITPATKLFDALNGMKKTGKMFPATQREWISNVKDNISEFEDVFYDFIEEKRSNQQEITPQELKVMSALIDLKRSVNQILATNALFGSSILNPLITSTTVDDKDNFAILNTLANARKRAASKEKIEEAFDGGLRIDVPSSVESMIVEKGDSLEAISLRVLGTASEWIEIALINDLVYPYIDETEALTNSRVKKSGDSLLVPSQKNNPILRVAAASRENYITSGMSPAEKFMGVDIQINADYDLMLTNLQDFDLVAGVDNAAQAINIRLALEKGSLRYHPYIGVDISIGSRSIKTVNEIVDGIRNSILSDDRFESITDVKVARVSNTFELSMLVKVVSINMPVPLTLKI